MGSGILPVSIFHNKLYFLLGKENKYCDSQGFSDFGGGTDGSESFIETALREGTEELTGFLGSKEELKSKMNKGTYDFLFDGKYKMFLLPIEYDDKLPFYYNNNQLFLQKNLDPNIIKTTKIFEKSEIKWICIDDFLKMRPQYRKHFKKNAIIIWKDREKIYAFAKKILKTDKTKIDKTKTTRRNRRSKNKTFKRIQ